MRNFKSLFFTLCVLLLGLSVNAQITYYINENFSTGTGATPPAGWTQNIIAGTAGTDTWRFNNPGSRTTAAPLSAPFAVFDSDNYSAGGGAENVALESPTVNTTGKTEIKLKWDQQFRGGFGGAGTVEVFDGISWVSVYTISTSGTTSNTPDIDVSVVAANKASVKVRFRWTGNYSWWWIVDNVQLYAPPPKYYFIQEPFTTATGSTPPSGWSQNIILGSATFDTWRFNNPGARTTASPISSPFAVFDSDNYSASGGDENVALESPIADATGFSSAIKLKWDQQFRGGFGGAAFVEVFNGTSWVQIYTINTSGTTSNTQDIDVTSHVANKSNARVRFRWTGNYSWWWIVDNVKLYAPAPTPVPSFTVNATPQCFTGNSFTFTNTSTIPGSNSTMSYSWDFGDGTFSTATSPTKTYAVAGTYNVTLTATSDLGISAASSAMSVTADNSAFPASVTISANPGTNVCPGTPIIFSVTGSTNGGASPSYQWKKNGVNVGTNSTTYNDAPVPGDVIVCDMTSSISCAGTATSNAMNITSSTAVTPSVTLTTSVPTTICQGTAVLFSATATNGGPTPQWQWKKNGVNVGTNAANYSSSSLANGDVISVVMTPSVCAFPSTATASKTMTVIQPIAPSSVTISANPGNTICSGKPVTFTCVATGAGSSPIYQWKRNGVNVGTNSATYNAGTGLTHLTTITCVVKSSHPCPASTTSNTITMNVTPTVTPTVSITTNTGSVICHGASVFFTANPTAPGSNPVFEWKLNGVVVGTNSNQYVTQTLPPGNHVVTCKVTNNATCVTSTTATGTYNIKVNPITTPSVTIASTQVVNGNICTGVTVTFTATPSGGGSSPVYQWKKNGQNVGSNSATYNAGTTLLTGDTITCTLTSNAPCTTTNNVVSNAVVITKWPNTTASVTITSSKPGNQACNNMPVTFAAIPTNGGPSPTYQWRKGGVNIPGATDSIYVDSVQTGGAITCRMSTNLPCATPATATSNTINLVVNAVITPSITVVVSPDSAGCEHTPFTFTTFFTDGGNAPQYKWYKNGIHIPGSVLPNYNNDNFANGDVISCELISSLVCAFPVMSNQISLEITPSPAPQVDIYGIPNQDGIAFYSNVTNAGSSPKFQWRKNNIDITGATTANYTLFTYLPTDKINLYVESDAPCAAPKFVLSNTLFVEKVTSVNSVASVFSDLQLFPNPNEGRFNIKGDLQNSAAREATVEVLNAIGQVVYKDVVKIENAKMDAQIDLQDRATAGMYTVRVAVDGQTQNMRFVLK